MELSWYDCSNTEAQGKSFPRAKGAWLSLWRPKAVPLMPKVGGEWCAAREFLPNPMFQEWAFKMNVIHLFWSRASLLWIEIFPDIRNTVDWVWEGCGPGELVCNVPAYSCLESVLTCPFSEEPDAGAGLIFSREPWYQKGIKSGFKAPMRNNPKSQHW